LLILKPTSKLPKKKPGGKFQYPSSVFPVSHMGGLKMHRNDVSYKAFVAWIQDYAKVVDGRYATVDELPADNWQPTRRILKLFDTPESWKKGTIVQLFLYTRNNDKKWNAKPIAFTQGVVNPRHRVAGQLFLFKPTTATKSKPGYAGKDAKRAGNPFPRGPFLVKVFVDSKARIAKDPTLLLSKEDFFGKAVLKARRWRIGFRQGKVIRGESLKK